jgi:hypothetical protein
MKNYPVHYHLHGWINNESSDIWTLNGIYKNMQVITVFPNNSPNIEGNENIPVEKIIINEFIPFIDKEYRTNRNQKIDQFLDFLWVVEWRFITVLRFLTFWISHCLCGYLPPLLS